MDLKQQKYVKTFLVGPIGSSSAGWPSFARGITAENPKYLKCNSIYRTKEENGFTFFKINNDKILAQIISCGGHNPDNNETGEIISKKDIYI